MAGMSYYYLSLALFAQKRFTVKNGYLEFVQEGIEQGKRVRNDGCPLIWSRCD
jgi:hypothetical protein